MNIGVKITLSVDNHTPAEENANIGSTYPSQIVSGVTRSFMEHLQTKQILYHFAF